MKTLKIIFTIFFLAIAAVSCSGDDGTDGVDGEDGATGTANVIYSAWINVPAGTPDTVDGTSGLSTSINVPQLSADILAKGTVLVYMSFGSGTNIYTLPYTSTAGGFANTITSIASLNKIKIFRFKHAADGTTVTLPANLNYRYILIPGGAAATTAKALKIDYSKMTFEEVCSHFNIQP